MKRKTIIILLIVLTVVLVAVYIISNAVKNSSKRKEELKKLREAIGTGISSSDDTVASALLNVEPDPDYDGSEDVKTLRSAIGAWYQTDNDDLVYETLSGKTIEQIKSIDVAMQNKHGESLENFLQEFFDSAVDWYNEGYQKAVNIIKSAI